MHNLSKLYHEYTNKTNLFYQQFIIDIDILCEIFVLLCVNYLNELN